MQAERQVDSLDGVESLTDAQRQILYELDTNLILLEFLGSPRNLDGLQNVGKSLRLTKDDIVVSGIASSTIIHSLKALKGIKDSLEADIDPIIIIKILHRESLENIPDPRN